MQGVLFCMRNLLRYFADKNLIIGSNAIFVFKMFQICLANSSIDNFD